MYAHYFAKMQQLDVATLFIGRGSRRDAGFTLLEILIVITLMTIILSLSIVLFANFLPSNRFKAVVRDVSTTFRHARALAQIHGERQTVIFDLDAGSYGIENRKMREIPPGIQIRIVDPIEGEVLNGAYRFRVNTVGTDGGTIVLEDGKREARIQMDPILGVVLKKDGDE